MPEFTFLGPQVGCGIARTPKNTECQIHIRNKHDQKPIQDHNGNPQTWPNREEAEKQIESLKYCHGLPMGKNHNVNKKEPENFEYVIV